MFHDNDDNESLGLDVVRDINSDKDDDGDGENDFCFQKELTGFLLSLREKHHIPTIACVKIVGAYETLMSKRDMKIKADLRKILSDNNIQIDNIIGLPAYLKNFGQSDIV